MSLISILNNPVMRAFSFLLFIGFCITIAYYKGYSACERDVALKLQRLTLIICVMLSMSSLTACATQTIPVVQTCPQRPELNPILNVIPEPNFSERLNKVWLSSESATR